MHFEITAVTLCNKLGIDGKRVMIIIIVIIVIVITIIISNCNRTEWNTKRQANLKLRGQLPLNYGTRSLEIPVSCVNNKFRNAAMENLM